MTAPRYFGTPAHRASVPTAPQCPARRYTQAELRERRNKGLPPGHYGADWSLAREIALVCEPLARRIAAADRPSRFRHSATAGSVPTLAEAVHELVGVAVGWVAEADAYAKTAHLAAEPGKRRYAVTTYIDLAQRPALPEITDEALADGSWAAALTAMANDLDAAFSDLLSRAYPPGAPELRGQPSRSDRLVELLRRTIDRAALALERRIDRDERAERRQTAQTGQTAQTPDDRARAELAALGIDA